MTFPTVESVTGTAFASDSDPWSVSGPATINADDVLILLASSDDSSAGFVTPSGWTQLYNQNVGSFGTAALFYKVASGSESFPLSLDLGKVQRGTTQVIRLSGCEGSVEQANTVDGLGGTTPDPPNLAPSWGADDNTWIAVCHSMDDDQAVTGWPTNYTDNQTDTRTGNAPSTNTSANTASATRDLNAASDNPSNFTLASGESWCATTIAVRGEASAATLQFAPTDSADTVSVVSSATATTSFAPSDAADTAFIVSAAAATASFAAVDAADVGDLVSAASATASFALTDAPDAAVFMLSAVSGELITFAVVDAPDVAAFSSGVAGDVAFGVVDAADVASFVLGAEAPKTVSFAVVDDPDVVALATDAAHSLGFTVTDAADVAVFSAPEADFRLRLGRKALLIIDRAHVFITPHQRDQLNLVNAGMGFGELARHEGEDVAGIFDDWSGGSVWDGPRFRMLSSVVDERGIDQGSVLEIRTRRFVVQGQRRDGTGHTDNILKEI